MCSMCHHCGAEVSNSKAKEDLSAPCSVCMEKRENGYFSREGLSPFGLPMFSPTTSLSSSDRSISSCSDSSVEVNSCDRGSKEDCMVDSGQDSFRLNHQVQKSSSGSTDNVDNVYSRTDSNAKMENTERVDCQEVKENASANNGESVNQGNETPHVGDDEVDGHLWEPPEAEDPDDEGSVALSDDDDDDECGDGTKWGNPVSLSCCTVEGNRSFKVREEKQKAIQEVIDGKFKAIVGQLLKGAGVASVKDSEWVDIVMSLSWEAASFLKPEAIDGKATDPDGYVKVKCIATGSRSESQVIKGLVFKKHAAHKHMPTKYKNPRLLLIRGVLGQSTSGLSSFKSMEQEKDNLKSLIETIELCHPNVILVEKSVSRDVQESILAKGMTLVYDMKLHRLERVARCTGSPILSSDALLGQKLKKCHSFHFERFVEEHAGLGEGGKKPSKTLMFIEGCPTRLGCTILLKGSHSDELKRVKYVIQFAVIMAYHLILETSFVNDQRAMLSTILLGGVVNNSQLDQGSMLLKTDNPSFNALEQSHTESEPHIVDIPVSNESHEGAHDFDAGLDGNSPFSYEPYNPAIFSGFSSLSTSLKKVMEGFPLSSSVPCRSLSNYFGLNGGGANCKIIEDIPISEALEASGEVNSEAKGGSNEKKSVDGGHLPLIESTSNSDEGKDTETNVNQGQNKDGVNTVLDSQSILVLMSSRNAMRGTMCEQSHFSHILFYKNFDIPLGKFLKENLLNQKSQCSTCGELPEAHFYYYAHHDKQLTIRVKRVLKPLPGEAEGKLWMWSRCGKCKKNGVPKSTKRVLISAAARSLSFGKFLELSFSHHLLSGRLSSCGHSLERDFLYFFGLGPMVAMFKYSPVTTYTVALPPLKLEFGHFTKHNALLKELQDVYATGVMVFKGIGETLERLKSQFVSSIFNLRGSLKEFSDIEEMLKQELSDFEAQVRIYNAVAKNGNKGESVYHLLGVNRLLWELLLESFVWERRLQSLLLCDPSVVNTSSTGKTMEDHLETDGIVPERSEKVVPENSDNSKDISSGSMKTNEFFIKEIAVSDAIQNLGSEELTMSREGSKHEELSDGSDGVVHHEHDSVDGQADNFSSSNGEQVERNIPIRSGSDDSFPDLDSSSRATSPRSLVSNLENSSGWYWLPISEIRQIYLKDLQRGFMPKFQSIGGYFQEHLTVGHQLINEEGSRLHIPLGMDDYIVRDYDDELSSIIACALAFLKDLPVSSCEPEEGGKKDGTIATKRTESLSILTRVPTMVSSSWPSNGSVDTDSVHSTLSISSDEAHLSSFDGLNLLESLVPPENLSPEVSLGVSKALGKGKYSVICLYAKQFHDLRSRCCPSELDYIASLSRCKAWDAKGGKSKSVFAKTLDNRFIIKEIKKAEFESFVKFAPHYFKYMNESYDLGNQTCLAKVLGIYQVILRQTKSGKEVKHDLMVMENLTFGRNITRQYDLKGALHDRYNTAVEGSGDVLLDQNFVNDMNSSPLYVNIKAKRLLGRAVWNDTAFLNSINVMDYSLLVGVDTQRRELVCGIIDYLRQYTWDKQLETWVKTSLVVPRNVLPTVISPKEYKKRFRKFMATHFLSVPDSWCLNKSQDSCELCRTRDGDSSPSKPVNEESRDR